MQRLILLLGLGFFCMVRAMEGMGDETIPDNAWKNALTKFAKRYEETELLGGSRWLQETMFAKKPPERQCGDVIGIATPEEVSKVLTLFAKAFFPDGSEAAAFQSVALQILGGAVKYGIYAQVICSSCAEIEELYAGSEFLSSTSPDGWESYCAPNKFGANTTQSSLLLVPYNNTLGKPVSGRLKGFVRMRGTTFGQQTVSSELYPSELGKLFDGFNETTEDLANRAFNIWIWPHVVAATSGVVSISPDFLGYGVSYEHNKGYLSLAAYKQNTVVAWLKAKHMIPQISNGCSFLDTATTLGGYSEGGLAAFVGALALQDLGVEILQISPGAAPFDLAFNVGWAVETIYRDPPNAPLLLRVIAPFLGYGFSSTNFDVVNSGTGQYFFSDDWLVPDNFTRNGVEWLNVDQTFSTLLNLQPADTLDLINPGYVEQMVNASAMNVSVCSIQGDVPLLCEGFLDNTVIDKVQNASFRVNICHSPDDETISFQNVPNVSANPNLHLFSLFGFSPSGGHAEANVFCAFGEMAPFTSINQGPDSKEILPLENPDTCDAPSSAPSVMPSAVPSMAPSASAGSYVHPETMKLVLLAFFLAVFV